MIKNCFHLNTGLAKCAKPQYGLVSLMHVSTITTTTRAQRPEGANTI